MDFLPDKDIFVGKGVGLGDIEQSNVQAIKSTWAETMAAVNNFTQQNIAEGVIKEGTKQIPTRDVDSFALGRAIRGQTRFTLPLVSGKMGFSPADAQREIAQQTEDIISKHDALAAQTGAKTSQELKDEYFKRLEEAKRGDESENRPLTGTILGVIGGALSDPTALIGGPLLKSTTLAKSTLTAFLTETMIQGNINATLEEKALNIGLATAGGAALHGLIAGAGRLLKGVPKGKTIEEAVESTSQDLIKSSNGSGADFVQNIGKMADETSDPVLKMKFKHAEGSFAPFKGTTKEVIINGERANARFNAYQPTGDIKTSFKVTPKKNTPGTQEVLDTLSARNLEPTAENFASVVRELDAPITSTGKYAHYVDRLETTRVVDGKKVKRVLPVAPEFETAELAAARIADILEKSPLHRELHVLPKANGKFGIAQESTLTYMPHTRNYKTAAEAELDIPRISKESGIPEADIKAVEGTFLEKRTGTTGTTFKLATGASEADLASIQQGLPYNFNESPVKLARELSEGVEEALPHVAQAEKMAVQSDLEDAHYEALLKNILNDSEIPDSVPGVGNKEAFTKYVEKGKKLIAEFDKCRGGK